MYHSRAAVLGLVSIIFLSGGVSSPAFAGFDDFLVATDAGSATGARVAVFDANLAIVTWQDSQGRIWTRFLRDHALAEPTMHGSGSNPAVCFTETECVLAYAAGPAIVVAAHDGASWGTPEVLTAGGAEPAGNPDFGFYLYPSHLPLAGPAPAAASSRGRPEQPLYLVWEQGSGIYLVGRAGGEWTQPTPVCTDGCGYGQTFPQVEPAMAGEEGGPRVYYRTQPIGLLAYRDFDGSGWSEPIEPEAFSLMGGRYDVAVAPDGFHVITSLGLQPPCPCNSILYSEETPAGWIAAEDLTQRAEEYNWPLYVGLGVCGDGARQVFWFQEFYSADFELLGQEIYWKQRLDGAWFDLPPGFFDGHAGAWTDVAGDPAGALPSFVWVESAGGSATRVYLRHPDFSSSEAPEALEADGKGDGALRGCFASPNPFQQETRLRFTLDRAGLIRFEIFDVRGRVVFRSPRGFYAAGPGAWLWDGRDGSGRELPAGVYRGRMIAGSDARSFALIRLEP